MAFRAGRRGAPGLDEPWRASSRHLGRRIRRSHVGRGGRHPVCRGPQLRHRPVVRPAHGPPGRILVDPEVGDRLLLRLGLRRQSSEVAETCSEADAFCCVTLSSCWIAWLIWPDPTSCSRQAAEISSTNAAVFLMSGTSRPSMSPACCARLDRVDRQRADLGRRRLAALGEFPHLARHHGKAPSVLAGLAASTAAFSASRSVWRRFPARWVLSGRWSASPRRRDPPRRRWPRIARRLAGDGLGLAGILGVLLHVGGHLLHRGGGLFGGGGLLGRALGELLGRGRQFLAAGGDPLAASATPTAKAVRLSTSVLTASFMRW